MLGMNLKLNSIAYCYPCISLGMGLPSYNKYIGLCVFLFVKTRVLLLCVISLCNSHNCQDLMVIKVSYMGS